MRATRAHPLTGLNIAYERREFLVVGTSLYFHKFGKNHRL